MLKRLLSVLIVWPVVVVIFLLALLRVSLINLDFVKPELEAWLNDELMQGISFEEIRGEWRHINPVLSLRNVSITSDTRIESLNIDQIKLEIDALSSLLTGRLVIFDVDTSIGQLTIIKDKNKIWSVNGIPVNDDSSININVSDLIPRVPRNLNLHVELLQVHDRLNETTHDIRQVESSIKLLDQIFHLKLNAILPQQLGKRINLVSRFRHDFSHAYLEVNDISIVNWAELFDLQTGRVENGILGGQFWLSLYKPDLVNVSGNFDVNDLRISSPKSASPLSVTLDQQFNLSYSSKQWLLQSNVNNIQVNGNDWKAFNTQLRWQPLKDNKIDGWISEIDISSILEVGNQLASIPEIDRLKETNAQGMLKDALFSFPLSQPKSLKLSTEIIDLSSIAVSPFPGVTGFNGKVVIDEGKASFKLFADKAQIDFTDQFRVPFEIDKLNLVANLNWWDDRWILQAADTQVENSDLKYQGRLWLEGNNDADPFMYLRAKFKDGKGSSTSKYLPFKILPEEATQWLDDGIVDAFVPSGDFIFHGRLQDIENYTDQMLGEFKITFAIEAAEVAFATDWPSAVEGVGNVAFHNMSMDIDLSSVRYQSIDKAIAKIQIKDYRDSELYVSASASSNLQPAFETWFSLPVGENFVSAFEPVTTRKGIVKSQLDLMIPLESDNDNVRVDLDLNFQDAVLEAPDWGLNLSHISGGLKVTEKEIIADEINARLFGEPLVANVSTDQGQDKTVIEASGNLSTQNLMRLLPDYLSREVEGQSQWDVKVSIANSKDPKDNNVVQIEGNSNLLGTALNFPYPAGKSESQPLPFSTQVNVDVDSSVQFTVSSQNGIQAQGFLQESNLQTELTGLDITLNNRLKDTKPDGFRLYGVIDYLPLSDWIEVIQKSVPENNQSSEASIDIVEAIDLESRKVTFLKQNFSDVDFSMNRKDGYFSIDLVSREAVGSSVLPFMRPQELPVIINMDYLKLDEQEENESESEIIPEDLFDTDFTATEFVYGEMNFQNLEFQARQTESQLMVNNFSISHEDIELKMNGNWSHNSSFKEQLTNLDISIKGKKVGQAIKSLGFGDFLHDGKIDFEGQIAWADGLFSFDTETLLGKAKLKIEDGILKNVDPGSGRLVGLFSLNALPRRLSLDFKDVIVSGLEFEKISGDYEITDGKLMTRNTKMKGESADVVIKGETDLVNKSYDQDMFVIPKIGDTLPVLGSLAAGNAVGWGLLLIKSLFKKQIDESVELQYRISGSWDDPQLDLIDKNQSELELGPENENRKK